MRTALADTAVGDRVLARVEADLGVELDELFVLAEGSVVVGGLAPRHVAGCGDVAGDLGGFLREVRGSQEAAGVLIGAADVDQVLDADGVDDLVTEGTDARVGFLGDVRRGGTGRDVARELAALELPLLAATVEETEVVVTVELEVPVGVGGEPVVVAAVEDDGVVIRDTSFRQEGFEALLADEVVADAVLEVLLPVELDGVRDVALVVGLGVFVDFDQNDIGVAEVFLDPVRRDER